MSSRAMQQRRRSLSIRNTSTGHHHHIDDRNIDCDDDNNDEEDDEDRDLITGAAQLLLELSSPSSSTTMKQLSNDIASPAMTIPDGKWRDTLCDIFRYGYCHGSVVTSLCCIPLATGQVISRLHLTILSGQAGIVPIRARSMIYISVVMGVFTFLILRVFLFLLIAVNDPNVVMTTEADWIEPSMTYYILCAIDDFVTFVGCILMMYQIYRVRLHVRTRYAIPGNTASDVTCSIICPSLVVAQLLRHTTDYEQYPSLFCFSDTGITRTAPSIV